MSHGTTTQRVAALGALLIGITLAAGCSGAKPFVYQPSAPGAAGTPLPVKVGVLPFQDGTEDFEKRGSTLQPATLSYNFTRTGVAFVMEPVTPALWARAFATDLAASGRFGGARFVFDASELSDEGYVVEGTVLKMYGYGAWEKPSEYEVALRAVRRNDGRTVWARTVSRAQKADRKPYDDCNGSMNCVSGLAHADLNRVMQDMFAEAGADLAQSLGGPAPRGAAPGQEAGPGRVAPPSAQDSVEDTIKRIMEGK